jgi:hypothetical protein
MQFKESDRFNHYLSTQVRPVCASHHRFIYLTCIAMGRKPNSIDAEVRALVVLVRITVGYNPSGIFRLEV